LWWGARVKSIYTPKKIRRRKGGFETIKAKNVNNGKLTEDFNGSGIKIESWRVRKRAKKGGSKKKTRGKKKGETAAGVVAGKGVNKANWG